MLHALNWHNHSLYCPIVGMLAVFLTAHSSCDTHPQPYCTTAPRLFCVSSMSLSCLCCITSMSLSVPCCSCPCCGQELANSCIDCQSITSLRLNGCHGQRFLVIGYWLCTKQPPGTHTDRSRAQRSTAQRQQRGLLRTRAPPFPPPSSALTAKKGEKLKDQLVANFTKRNQLDKALGLLCICWQLTKA